MRNILVFIILLVAASCLKKDILTDEYQTPNIQQSQFYTSGGFAEDLEFEVVEMDVEQLIKPTNDTLCKPTITFKLKESYSSQLADNWSDEIQIVVQDVSSSKEYSLWPNYADTFVYTHKAVPCNSTIELVFQLRLISPLNQRVVAHAEKEVPVVIIP